MKTTHSIDSAAASQGETVRFSNGAIARNFSTAADTRHSPVPAALACFALAVGLFPGAVWADTIFNNETGADTLGGYEIGLYVDGSTNYKVGFNFTVPAGSDYQLQGGDFIGSLNSGVNDVIVSLCVDQNGSPGVAIETWNLQNSLQATIASNPFTSVQSPILLGGQQYWLTASMADSASTAVWWTPSVPSPGLNAASANGAPYVVTPLPRGAFSISSTQAPTIPVATTGVLSGLPAGLSISSPVVLVAQAIGGKTTYYTYPLSFVTNPNGSISYTAPNFGSILGGTVSSEILANYTNPTSGNSGLMLLAADSSQTSGGLPFLTGNPFNVVFPNAPSESNLEDALPQVDPNNPSDVPTELQAFGNAYPGLLAESGVLAGGAPFFDITGEAIGYSDGTVLGTFDTTLTATPEPGSMCLLVVGALGLLGRKMRRNGKQL